jgi:Transposase and inactivated derivatives
MAKYRFEFKKKIVQEYLQGKGGATHLSKKYNVDINGHGSTVLKWVNAYKEFGDEGIMRSRKNDFYTFEFKLHVVELYLSTEVSYQELALSVGMNNPPLITKWVNDFRIAGPDALRPKKKGRKKSLGLTDKEKNTPSSSEVTAIDTSAEHVKQLEDELLKLRIENAYLKELRRLRLEDEARLREQQESSTASEETSN